MVDKTMILRKLADLEVYFDQLSEYSETLSSTTMIKWILQS